mmetsp:Transcript_64841/g.125098  ORF Transcript_64841/g.125098 Transcript_64841/m.125098 type:complete len:106 (+) Transcript_64841:1271-1588(+)
MWAPWHRRLRWPPPEVTNRWLSERYAQPGRNVTSDKAFHNAIFQVYEWSGPRDPMQEWCKQNTKENHHQCRSSLLHVAAATGALVLLSRLPQRQQQHQLGRATQD